MIPPLIIGLIGLIVPALSANEAIRARSYIYEAVPNGVGQKVIGVVDFETSGTFTKLNGSISGLAPGLHGFHVHEKGDIANACLAAGAHFNPHKMDHGAPSDSNRHVGDLGNINTPATGDTIIMVSDSLVSLSGIHSVLGRAIVVHEKPDDLGKGGSPDSLKTGNAGARLGCGVIGILDEIEVTTAEQPLSDSSSTLFLTTLTLLLGLLLVKV